MAAQVAEELKTVLWRDTEGFLFIFYFLFIKLLITLRNVDEGLVLFHFQITCEYSCILASYNYRWWDLLEEI